MHISVKFPRTPHFPFSPGFSQDDEKLINVKEFEGRSIVVTEKMDGENTTLYSEEGHVHARSTNSMRAHESRDWIKGYHSRIRLSIPAGYRICGENLYATHSIYYDKLPHFFLGFAVFDNQNECLSWDRTIEVLDSCGVVPVPVLYEGLFDWEAITNIAHSIDTKKQEGFVVRCREAFHMKYYGDHVAKWVRKNHVAPEESSWFNKKIMKNKCL